MIQMLRKEIEESCEQRNLRGEKTWRETSQGLARLQLVAHLRVNYREIDHSLIFLNAATGSTT
jgi:hypothetical protein